MSEKNKKIPKRPLEDLDNPGLDADHSSDTGYRQYNADNDIVSENPDGESDHLDDTSGAIGDSPLRDK